MTVRLRAKDIRTMGRTARGNKTVKLKNDDIIADCAILKKENEENNLIKN